MKHSALTYEVAERLRKQVTVDDHPELGELCVISGKSENVAGEIRGSVLLQAQVGPRRMWTGHAGWIWRGRAVPPTDIERETVPDFTGISSGDPVTFGHLQALGIGEVAD